MSTLASAAQAVTDMSRDRQRDFDTYAMGWLVAEARSGEPWAEEFLAQVLASFNATVREVQR